MRNLTLSIMAVVVSLFVATHSFADTNGNATAAVYVTVDPNVAVVPETPIVEAGSVQTGDFTATICFRVDANMQMIYIFCEVSPLYKGDDPTEPDVPAIPINLSAGCEVQPTDGNPINAGSPILTYVGAGAPIMDYPTELTETVCFESSQNNHFSQSVYVTPTWNQDDPEKPTGQYSGKVRMTVLVVPDVNGGTDL